MGRDVRKGLRRFGFLVVVRFRSVQNQRAPTHPRKGGGTLACTLELDNPQAYSEFRTYTRLSCRDGVGVGGEVVWFRRASEVQI